MTHRPEESILLNTDSYKFSHWKQYPPATKFITSYIEARGVGGIFKGMKVDVVNFGVQMVLHQLGEQITQEDIDFAEPFVTAHGFEFNRAGWQYILDKHNGYLPLHIQALRDGEVVPTGTPQLQVTNTDPNVPWLVSYIETMLLRGIWYPSTVATHSREVKKVIKMYLEHTGDPSLLPFKLHDFGARGATSKESAAIGGCAHLVNFMGTDTVGALVNAKKYYGADMAGFSIPAAEHSTITSWGGPLEEHLAFENMIEQFGGDGKLYAVVSDSYDYFNAVDHLWGEVLKDRVIRKGGTLVIRPDSGEPAPTVVATLNSLWQRVGGTTNTKGYKVLNPHFRVIWGDGIDGQGIISILDAMKTNGFSADNIAFGMGGGLLQKMDRDTLKYAMKCNAICFDADPSKWLEVQKKPKTDASKASKPGRLVVYSEEDGRISWAQEGSYTALEMENMLETCFVDGVILFRDTFDQVRKRAELK